MSISIGKLNGLPDPAFVDLLCEVAEHSPWVVERTIGLRPFKSLRRMHKAMMQVIGQASSREQMALIGAHPDLAGKAARAGSMTEASVGEQAGAGLDRLTDEEFDHFQELNDAYRSKFGFPFILAVRDHDKSSILKTFETRLQNDSETERSEALSQIGEIIRYRLEDIIVHEAQSDA